MRWSIRFQANDQSLYRRVDVERHVIVVSSGDEENQPAEANIPPKTEIQPTAPTQKNDVAEDDDDDFSCSICFEPFANSGAHHICSAACGHVFGRSCIDTWIGTKRDARCPTCKAKLKKSDLRRLYVKALRAVDTAQLEALKRDLEAERRLKRQVERERDYRDLDLNVARAERQSLENKIHEYGKLLLQLREHVRKIDEENAHLKDKVARLQQQQTIEHAMEISSTQPHLSPKPPKPPSVKFQFIFQHVIKVTNITPGARVMDMCRMAGFMAISRPNPANPNQHGILKVSAFDPQNCTESVPHVHDKPIRDLRFSPTGDGLVLTTAFDKQLKISSLARSSCVLHSFDLQALGWSCCWNLVSNKYVFAGTAGKQVLVFDTGYLGGCVKFLQSDKLGKIFMPIHSLEYIYEADGDHSSLLVATQHSVCLWKNPCADLDEHVKQMHAMMSAPLQEPEDRCQVLIDQPGCISATHHLDQYNNCHYVVAWFRDTQKSWYEIRKIERGQASPDFSVRLEAPGIPKLMAKSSLITSPIVVPGQNKLQSFKHLLPMTNESTHSVVLADLDATSPEVFQVLETNANSPIMLVKSWDMLDHEGEKTLIAILTESQLIIYAWKCSNIS